MLPQPTRVHDNVPDVAPDDKTGAREAAYRPWLDAPRLFAPPLLQAPDSCDRPLHLLNRGLFVWCGGYETLAVPDPIFYIVRVVPWIG